MGNQRKRRAARRRLKAHERGDDRHVKSAAYRGKRNRQADEQVNLVDWARRPENKRGASWQVRTSDGSESAVTNRDAGVVPRDGADSNSARRPNFEQMAGLLLGGSDGSETSPSVSASATPTTIGRGIRDTSATR